MYAVIETGGKQYKVALGEQLKVEKLAVEKGGSVQIERVLMVADGGAINLGAALANTAVSATVVGHGLGAKIRVFKMKRRKHYRRTLGHRQAYTEIKITAIGEHKAESHVAAKTAAKAAVKAAKDTSTVDAASGAKAEIANSSSAQSSAKSAAKPAAKSSTEPAAAKPAAPKSASKSAAKPAAKAAGKTTPSDAA